MMQMDESRKESIQEEARRAKVIAVEKYNAGDLAGAKEFAVKAKYLDPELCGLRRLNAVLDVQMAFEKKINGEVDWYGVLSADPTEDLVTSYKRYRTLARDIISDRDDSVGGIDEAQKIIANAWRYMVKEKTKQIYAMRCEAQPSSRVRFNYVEPLLTVTDIVNRLRSINGGESKRKGPPSTDPFHAHQLRRILDAGKRDRLELTPNMLRSPRSLETYVSASQHKNIGAAAKTETLQDSKKCDAAKREKIVNEEEPNEVVMSVPDADFYDFDKYRTEASFGENQVWAAYDDYGMPRFYALVHRVVSREPFKLCISWLNSKKNEELGTMKWIDSGYYKTSGNFSIGKRSNNKSLNSFSHRVEWEKGTKGMVHIYPKKGNVWALYTNWSPSWDISTSIEVMNKYEMVEVLQDFDEEGGVTVAPLVKLPGFQTVFRRHPTLRTYPRKELFRFSHQVASHVLTGKEDKNAPKGCLELDPAALSQELLKVFTEDEMRELENVVNKPKEQADEVVETISNVTIDYEECRKLEMESNNEVCVQVYKRI